MRLANLTLEEMTEALNRGWAERDSRVAMLLQEERSGVDIRVPATPSAPFSTPTRAEQAALNRPR